MKSTTHTICSKSEERGKIVKVRDSFPEEDLKKYREEIKKNEVLLGMVLLRQHKAGALQFIVGSTLEPHSYPLCE